MSDTPIPEWRCPECGREYDRENFSEQLDDNDWRWNRFCPADGAAVVPIRTLDHFGGDPLLGRVIDDRYAVFDILGLGGFGAVYRCLDVIDNREVALKTIRPGAEERTGADVRARFLQEARLLSELDSPYIVKVHSFAETNAPSSPQLTQTSEDKLLYMVMDLVLGPSLKRVLKQGGPIGIQRAATISVQILHALEYAHSLGLVHRDLKPGNILLVDKDADHIKVIDFGIAKVLAQVESEEGPKTGTGLVLGTVRYMAPEQLKAGGLVGPPSDLYAMGVLFYQMVMGQTPFDGSQAEMAAGHLYKTPPPLSKSVLEQFSVAAADLQRWLNTSLEKDVGNRYCDASTMRLALQEVLPTMATEPHQMMTRQADTLRLEVGRFQGTVKSRVTKEADTAFGPERSISDTFDSEDDGFTTGARKLKQTSATRGMSETVRLHKPRQTNTSDSTDTVDSGQAVKVNDEQKEALGQRWEERQRARFIQQTAPHQPPVARPEETSEVVKRIRRNRERDLTDPTEAPHLTTNPTFGKATEERSTNQSRLQGDSKKPPPGPSRDDQKTLLIEQMARGIPSDGSSSIRTRGELGLEPRRDRKVSFILPAGALVTAVIMLLWLEPMPGLFGTKVQQLETPPPIVMPDINFKFDELESGAPEPTTEPKTELEAQQNLPPPAVVEKPATAKQDSPKEKSIGKTTKRRKQAKQKRKRTPRSVVKKTRVSEKAKVGASSPTTKPPIQEKASSGMIHEAINKLSSALQECRCKEASMILQELPRDYPNEKRRALRAQVIECRVPTVDEQCIDGKVQ